MLSGAEGKTCEPLSTRIIFIFAKYEENQFAGFYEIVGFLISWA